MFTLFHYSDIITLDIRANNETVFKLPLLRPNNIICFQIWMDTNIEWLNVNSNVDIKVWSSMFNWYDLQGMYIVFSIVP